MRRLAVMCLGTLLVTPSARAEAAPERPINLWPLYYRRALPDGLETEALFWLYAHTRTGASSVTSVRPLLRHERSPGLLSSRLFPLYDFKREGTRRVLGLGGLSPFTAASFESDSSSRAVSRRLLFWLQRRDPGTQLLELPPLWADRRDSSGARRVSALGAPDVFNLFERRLEPSRGLSEWHALSVWRRDSPEDSFLHVWPFYARRTRGPRTDRGVLWPLGAWASDPSRGLAEHRAWPLWAESRAEADDEPPADLTLHLALPVPLWYRARARGRAYRRFLFVHWAARTPERATHVTVPWYSIKGMKTGTSHRGLFPLYHGSRWEGRSFDMAPPLFFSWRDETSRLGVFLPFYFGHADGERSFDYFFPLYGRSKRDGRVTRRFLLFPLYARRSEPGHSELDLLWPLVHVERSSAAASTRLLPLYWSARRGEDSFTLAPLYGSLTRGEETMSVLFPLYWRLGSRDRNARFFPPLGGLVRDVGERDAFLLGLIPELSLFRSVRAPEYASDRALLYYRRREPRTEVDAFFPLCFRWNNPTTRGLVLFPLYASDHTLDDGARRRAVLGLTGGFSLFEWAHEPAEGARRLRALLFYRESRGASARTWLFPLYSERREPKSRARGVLGFSPRWSLLSRTEEGEAVETRFLWRLARRRRAPDGDAFELNPLFFTEREGDRRYSALLGGLLGLESGPEGRRWRWLWVL